MAKISFAFDEPIQSGAELKPVAAEDVLSFEMWLQHKGAASKLTNGEKLILMDYIYFKWESGLERSDDSPPPTPDTPER